MKRPATALDRTRLAVQRDESARRRDLSAMARDRSADARDRAAARRESALPTQDADRRVKRPLSGLRSAAALDRAAAAADRERAAADREAAAIDRRQARVDLARAHLDDLTGVYSRGLGQETLRNEVARAHRVGHPFTLAFLDVDGLKALNDSNGHAAGDEFLRAVAAAIRLKLRSYDPVVRVGGDEFVCGFVDTALDAAVRRMRGDAGRRWPRATRRPLVQRRHRRAPARGDAGAADRTGRPGPVPGQAGRERR